MKRIASVISLVGVASGVFVVLWSLISSLVLPGPGLTLMPLLAGVVLAALHWLTFRKIQTGSAGRFGLLLPNAILLVVILVGFIFMPTAPSGDHGSGLKIFLPATFLLLPLASNVIYLSFQARSSDDPAFSG